MTKRFWAGVVLCGALVAASSPQAHHSLAGVYDLGKTERATGAVQQLKFTNPHGSLVIDISAKGAVVWRGIGEAKIKPDLDRREREALLREAAEEILQRVPRRG